MWAWLLYGCWMPVAKPTVEEGSPANRDSLGGVEVDAPFSNEGFTCEPGRCEKPAELAGVTGTLIVWTCGPLVHRVGFREEFYLPDAIAAQFDEPNTADSGRWVKALADALKTAGFVREDLNEAELAEFRRLLGPPSTNSQGVEMAPDEVIWMAHPDGRERTIYLKFLPLPPAVTAIDPLASKLQITLGTIETSPCTAGI